MPRRTADAEPELPAGTEPDRKLAPGKESGPEELKIQQALAFYRAALRRGPRLAREVLAEGKRHGHAQRTQERARSRLNVQKIPPTTWQGPWLIALSGDPAVATAKQRRKEKERKQQQRKGNGRQRKQQDGGGVQPKGAMIAAAH